MSATTTERYARRRRSEATKLSQQRAKAWSDMDDDRPLQMSDDKLDRWPSDTDIQVTGPVSDVSERQMEDQPVERPAAPAALAALAAIPMEALLAIT